MTTARSRRLMLEGMKHGWFVVLALAASRPAHAERPDGWLARATPGLGYAWDSANGCRFQGRVFAGGFSVEHAVVEGLFVGLGTTILFNLLLPDAPCATPMPETRLALGMEVGPSLEWFPTQTGTFHVFAHGGFAELDDGSRDETMRAPLYGYNRGVGATAGVGWDERVHGKGDVDLLFGLRAQLAALRTWTGDIDHQAVAFSLHVTFGFD